LDTGAVAIQAQLIRLTVSTVSQQEEKDGEQYVVENIHGDARERENSQEFMCLEHEIKKILEQIKTLPIALQAVAAGPMANQTTQAGTLTPK
jgi:hypothetical protein